MGIKLTDQVKRVLLEGFSEAGDESAPFAVEGGKLFVRYDQVNLYPDEIGRVTMKFYYKGEHAFTLMAGWPRPGEALTLGGFEAKMEVTLSTS